MLSLTEADITKRVWSFGRTNGELFGRNMVLAAEGRVLHYDSPNERRWRIEDNKLVLISADGTPSCRMHVVTGPDPQRLWLEGEHLLHGSTGIHLALRETGIVYPVHIFWSSAIEDFVESVPFSLNSIHKIRGVYLPGELITIPAPAFVEPYSALPARSFITTGAYSYCHGSFNSSLASVGRYCSIAGGSHPFGPSHPLDRVSTNVFSYDPRSIEVARAFGRHDYEITPYDQMGEPVIIENDVWVCEDVLIRAGVTIGTGAVLGARSVVTKDVPPYGVVTGVPGKVIKSRFPAKLVDALLESRWWDYNFCDLPRNVLEPKVFVEDLRRMKGEGLISPWCPPKIDLAEAFLRIGPPLVNGG